MDVSVLNIIPSKPGVYIFKKGEEHIYIGKAKNLKKRLSSHFKSKEGKSLLIVQEADKLDYIITDNEKEALILEATLIFEYKPKYNTALKDTQAYPYIRISNDEIPYVEIVRNRKEDGTYFGPYTNVYFTRQFFEVLRKIFKFRTCTKDLKKIKRPCMEYYLGRCSGICIGLENPDEYLKRIEELKSVLSGKFDIVIQKIKDLMEQHSKLLNFEIAAKYRDLLQNFTSIIESQGVVLNEDLNVDVIVLENNTFLVFKVRNGYLLSKLLYEGEISFEEFLYQFYYGKKSDLPQRIIAEHTIDFDIPVEKPNSQSEITLLKKAKANLEYETNLIFKKKEILKQAKELLGLSKIPLKIEGVDISHTSGKNTVASLIVMENGELKKEEYRKYKLGDILDDFESIRIFVKKRYSKHLLPDLLFVDGGIGQVNSAYEELKRLGKVCDIVGLTKENEILVTKNGEVKLHFTHDVLRIFVKLRDETHRFANKFSEELRIKRSLKSQLDEIPGIGPKRKKILLEKYKTLENLKNASLSELEQLLGKKVAQSLISKLFND